MNINLRSARHQIYHNDRLKAKVNTFCCFVCVFVCGVFVVFEEIYNNAPTECTALSGRVLRYQWHPEHLLISQLYQPCQQDLPGPYYGLRA